MVAWPRWRAVSVVVLATVCWATSGIFISLIARSGEIAPVALAFWRDCATFLCLLAGIALLQPASLRVRRQDLPWLAALGLFSVGLLHALWVAAVLAIGVAMATILQATAPLMVTIAAWLLWREPLSPRKLAALAIAFSGILLIAGPGARSASDVTLLGLGIGLASAVALAGFTLFSKKLTGSYSSWTVLLYAFGFATLGLAPFAIGRPAIPAFTPTVLTAFAGLVLISSVSGFGLYTIAVRHLPASVAAISVNSEMIIASLFSWWILDERLTPPQVAGACLVAVAVALISLDRRRVRVVEAV